MAVREFSSTVGIGLSSKLIAYANNPKFILPRSTFAYYDQESSMSLNPGINFFVVILWTNNECSPVAITFNG
jgi:hypothetical protein